MANTTTPKPEVGTVAPVVVQAWYKHPLVIIATIGAAIPTLILVLVQLQDLPGLPTNVLAMITSAIGILTAVLTLLRQLGLLGMPSITPTAAAKLIQTDPNEGK